MNRDERNELVMLLELAPKIMMMDPRNAQMLKDAAAEIRRLVEGLEEIEKLGHSSHHGRGYTLGTIAQKLLEGHDGKD